MRNLFTGLFFLLSIQLHAAAHEEYSTTLIPDSLLKGANSVVRLYEVQLNVTSPSYGRYKCHKVITVLNEAGADELNFFIYYNRFMQVISFSARIYDKDGKLMNKRTEAELNDYAAYDGFSLFSDARYKQLRVSGGTYPVTFDYTYTLDYVGVLDYPVWYIQEPFQSVQYAQYSVVIPESVGAAYKVSNINLPPVITTETASKTYNWKAYNLPCLKLPSHSYSSRYYMPKVDLSPAKFEMDHHQGSLTSWADFGRSMFNMWKDKNILPENAITEVKAMVANAKTEREKVTILYNYLQSSYRYVSIQIGIGGYIPFDATTVYNTKYGDCKALSNYMYAMLSAIGIKSYPVLINAGDTEHAIDTSFTTNSFNHAILCAQLKDGPMWLECTSTSLPAGHLGSFTENRYGLALTPEGGKILKTPSSDYTCNIVKAQNKVVVNTALESVVHYNVSVTGEERRGARNYIMQGDEKNRSYYIYNNLGLRQLADYELGSNNDSLGYINFSIKGNAPKFYDFKAGNKVFLPSSSFKSMFENIAIDTNITTDYLLDYPYQIDESLVYELPVVTAISMPANFSMDNDLVKFERLVSRNGNTVIVNNNYILKKAIIKPAELKPFKESLQQVNKQMQQRLTFE